MRMRCKVQQRYIILSEGEWDDKGATTKKDIKQKKIL